MVDRDNLRDTAQSIGSSVAGTFKSAGSKAKAAGKNVAKNTKKGAGQIKDDVSGTGATGDDVSLMYDQENERYIVFAGDRPVEQFDDEMQAKAYARNLKGRIENAEDRNTSSVKDKFKSAATNAAESFDQDGADIDDESGDTSEEGNTGPTLPGFGGSSASGDNSPDMPFMSGDGDADSDGDGPMLPGFGPQGGSEDGEGPTVPGFGGGDSEGQPQVPAFGGGSDGQPELPMFGQSDEETDDSERYPWMF